jgi:hypothetical protein
MPACRTNIFRKVDTPRNHKCFTVFRTRACQAAPGGHTNTQASLSTDEERDFILALSTCTIPIVSTLVGYHMQFCSEPSRHGAWQALGWQACLDSTDASEALVNVDSLQNMDTLERSGEYYGSPKSSSWFLADSLHTRSCTTYLREIRTSTSVHEESARNLTSSSDDKYFSKVAMENV